MSRLKDIQGYFFSLWPSSFSLSPNIISSVLLILIV